MTRRIEIVLERRGVRAVAELLDEEAPKTCAAVWDALPVRVGTYHAKWASNEIFVLVPPFAAEEPGRENATVFPIPGDLCCFLIPPGAAARHLRHGRSAGRAARGSAEARSPSSGAIVLLLPSAERDLHDDRIGTPEPVERR